MYRLTWNRIVIADLQTCEAILGRKLTPPEILQRVEALLKLLKLRLKYTPPQDE